MQVKIEYRDPEWQEEVLVTKADRSQHRAVFLRRTTSVADKSLSNGDPVRAVAKWVGDKLSP